MPFYTDSNMLYTLVRTTFTKLIRESPDHLDGLRNLVKEKMVVELRTTNPHAEITLNARDKEFKAIYGPTTVKPDLLVNLTADDLHLILMDQLSIKKAWLAGRIKVKGPALKLSVLADLIEGAREYYPQVMKEYQAVAKSRPTAKPAVRASKTATKKAGL